MDYKHTMILAMASIVSFTLSALLGRVVIPWLHKLKFGQTIREEGPSWHEKKQGTPTMGGILFMAGFLAAALLCAWLIYFLQPAHMFMSAYEKVRYWGGIGLAFGCGVIGFADDFIKVVKKRNLGLTAIQKLIAQLVVATGYAVLMYCYLLFFSNGLTVMR